MSWRLLTRPEAPRPWQHVAALRSLERLEADDREEREGLCIVCGIVCGLALACLFELALRVVL